MKKVPVVVASFMLFGGVSQARPSKKGNRAKGDIGYRSSNFFENLGDKAIENDFTLDVNLVANASSSQQ